MIPSLFPSMDSRLLLAPLKISRSKELGHDEHPAARPVIHLIHVVLDEADAPSGLSPEPRLLEWIRHPVEHEARALVRHQHPPAVLLDEDLELHLLREVLAVAVDDGVPQGLVEAELELVLEAG